MEEAIHYTKVIDRRRRYTKPAYALDQQQT
jgi:hypothetical protein